MRRLIATLFLSALLCLGAWAQTTYYVDTNADPGGDGTTTATTGAHCAWDTIADVNGASFSAGDIILFRKGQTWREQLTVPSSGSAYLPVEDQTGSTYNYGDFTATNAFFWSSLDLSSFAGTDSGHTPFYLELVDGTGKKATGFIGAVGAGETLGSELLTNGGFDSDTTGWTGQRATLASVAGGQSGNCLEITDTEYLPNAYQDIPGLSTGSLYKGSAYVKAGTGPQWFYEFRERFFGTVFFGGTLSASWVLNSGYAHIVDVDNCSIDCWGPSGLGLTSLFDETTFKQVTDPPATAVHIVSAYNGSTRAWGNIESGFNPNTITTWAIYDLSASGTITFGAYGTGDDPIISGADLVMGWTADLGTSLSTDANTVGLWKFNQNLDDDSGNGYDLTDNAAITYSNSGAIYEYYGIFDGTDYVSYTDTGDYFDFGAEAFTVEAIFNIPTDPGANLVLVCKSAQQGTVGWMIQAIRTNENLTWMHVNISDGTHSVDITDADFTNVMGNGWHHIAAVFDAGGTTNFYLDGSLAGTASTAAVTSADNSVAFTIGAESDGARMFKGYVEEVRVSNIPRTTFFVPAGGQANLWQAAVTTEPKVVLFDATLGTNVASKVLTSGANKWFWASNILWIYSTTDPDSAYVAPGMQAGARAVCIDTNDKSYIVVDGVRTEAANTRNILVETAQSNITVQNCDIFGSGGAGIQTAATIGDCLFDGNTISYCATCGINAYLDLPTTGHETTISNNTITHCSQAGIEIRGNYFIVENNTVHDNGLSTNNYHGIHAYSGSAEEGTGDNVIIRYNIVYNQKGADNDGAGIEVDQWCADNSVYYNICYHNDAQGILGYDADDIAIYNNITYDNCQNSGGAIGATVKGEIVLISSNDLTDGSVKNNIAQSTQANTYAIIVDATTLDNAITITNNCWYSAATNWYLWGASAGATLATWNALTGVGTDLNSDPLMTNPDNGDFTLQSGSPCINAGTDVGLTEDYTGNPVPLWNFPDIGAYEYILKIKIIKRVKMSVLIPVIK